MIKLLRNVATAFSIIVASQVAASDSVVALVCNIEKPDYLVFLDFDKSKKILEKHKEAPISYYYLHEFFYYEHQYNGNPMYSFYEHKSYELSQNYLLFGHKNDCYKSKEKILKQLFQYISLFFLTDTSIMSEEDGPYGSPW